MRNKKNHSEVDDLIKSAMNMKNVSLEKWKALRKEIMELGGYLPQYPIEMRNRFWEHGLNPITGTPPVLDSSTTNTATNKSKYIEIL
jgi:hypothetical protein